ncbi:MAG: DUF1080 domain-containing protein [Bacteroidetes bacterium]|nr:DUF1080 domain-containing protein [Bacteroidota bacterium]
MKSGHFILVLFLATVFASSHCNAPKPTANDPSKENWISLFNGKDLDGWDVKIAKHDLYDNYQNTFSVKDGMIQVSYDGYGSFDEQYGHLFYRQPFSYYRLKVEYRFVGEQVPGGEGWAWRNSGAMLHGQSAASMKKNQDFPISLEAQFLGGNGKDVRHTLNLCTPGTHVKIKGQLKEDHCMESTSKTYHGDQWVAAEFLVLGDSLIQHILDDEVVFEFTDPVIGGGVVNNFDPAVKLDGTPISSGTISLQSESHPIHFRKVKLLNLEGCMDKKAKNYKAYLVKHNPGDCVY